MSLLTEERRIAALLISAERYIARGCKVSEAAAAIGVPTATLIEWREQLARAQRRHERRRHRFPHQPSTKP